MNKREFIRTLTLSGLALTAAGKTAGAATAAANLAPAAGAAGDFWDGIRSAYRVNPAWINLENGYYCILPQSTLEASIAHARELNFEGSHYLRTRQADDKAAARKLLAEFAGCATEEVVITRNTTESLDTVISGFDWKAGDEAVMAEQDYGAMLDMFKQVAHRYGVVNKVVSVPANPQTDEEILAVYEQAITPRTKLLMVCHMINITGQILPVRKICDMAHARGVQVMVDGAHALAHIQFKIPELHCDYYGSSLHKWLSVPLGAGMLYVKKENIKKVWPLLAEGDRAEDDISRLNHTGTIPVATDLTIADAIDFFDKMGAERKEARLRYLQNYWTNKVRNLPHVQLYTPSDPARSCAIANVGIKGMKPGDMAKTLLDKYKIYTVAIDSAGVHGCRITPNVYTTTTELDALVAALKEMRG